MGIDLPFLRSKNQRKMSRAEHPQEASSGWGEAKEFLPARPSCKKMRRSDFARLGCHSPIPAHFKPRSPLSHKTSDTKKLENIRENATLRNGKMQNLSNMEITESKVDLESRFRVLVLDSDSESKTDSESKAENLGSTESKTLTESSSTDSKENLDSKIHYFRFKFRI